ncbi:MAG: BolA family protein [Gammaproteobacteria bacterium]
MTDADGARRILEARLRSLSPSRLTIADESRAHRGHREAGAGAHFRLEIVSPRFSGASPLSRHRMVFAAVGDLAAAGVHALSVKTFAPGELSEQEKQQ